jgi:hypothetical protein
MVTGFALFGTIKATVGLRVTRDEELEGLDLAEHGAAAYPDFQGAIGSSGVGGSIGGPSGQGRDAAYAASLRPETA